jgi:HEAT repeat protein
LVGGAACGGGAAGNGDVDPVAALEAFDSAPGPRARSFARLDTALIAEPAATRDAALTKLDAETRDVRLAAVYALGLTLEASDADRLTPFLESADVSERLLAATGMLSVGDARGVPVLIAALGSDDVLPLATPIRAWEQARLSLLTFTGQDLGLREADRLRAAAATKARWEAWWTKTGDAFELVRAPSRFTG